MRTWFITGVSTGLGRSIAEAALDAGDTVYGTVRKAEQITEFEALKPGTAHGLQLDVTDFEAIPAAVAQAGDIDVLVNNAGYGLEGIVEECSLQDFRDQMEPNLFGAFAVAKAVLPGMRAKRSGHILNITSMGGIRGFPGVGLYNASKFALEGLSEAMHMELKDLGIHVTAVEPGGFRTDWAGRSMTRVARSIPDYDAVMEPSRQRRQELSGNQTGDPAKIGQAILKLVASDDPPAHLRLGSDAVQVIDMKLDWLRKDYSAWQDVTLSTDYTG